MIFPPRPSEIPVGAVMVVGGGIAGMQASLDLAEQGFKVFLVEEKSAIGGKMAQLDKTFPTNDCAMCTISPKLVETGRHPNIELLTNSKLLDVIGSAGHFQVTVRSEPRYIDSSKCVACGDCVKVCPVIVPDKFNEGLIKKHAVYKLYPQAVPNAYAIEKRGIAPCRDACPSHQRAQGYIALIREGRWEDALRVIKMDNPFPGICGRICNHRCETACNRGQVDEPINIRALKRFVTDKVYAQPYNPIQPTEIIHEDQRVAIIGAGPCGLTAAKDLILAGYPVSVFEAMPVAGGMLRLGVPEYRLPNDIIEREVQEIIDLGVDLRLNTQVNNLDDLFEEGYSSVLIAVGAHEGIRLPIPGANLPGVLINTHFLRDVRLGKYTTSGEQKDGDGKSILGKNVLVLGGGNVAIDVARTAVRLGCKVSMACLESHEGMPAHAWEVMAAEEEGIKIYPGRTFERVLPDSQGHVSGVECMLASSFSFDEIGRLSIDKVAESNHVIECDTVIFSVGQRAGLAFIPDDAGVGLTQRKTIAINPNTFAATRPGVFAAGDSVSGTAFVIEAVHSGHKAAESIVKYLQGEQLEPLPKPELPVVHLTHQEIEDRIARGEIHRQGRIEMPILPVAARISNFIEVEGGYDDESAQAEAARCLACGICSECMSCTFACGTNAIDHDMVGFDQKIDVGALILAPGFQTSPAEQYQELGFGRNPNVVTALQFERLLSASGPTTGHVKRPSDSSLPKRIAFLQCVGSRDQTHDYCSAICCMSATKESIIAKEHHPDLDIHIFMMDMRAFSKGYLSYFERARARYGIHYHRARISSIRQDPSSNDLILQHTDVNGTLVQDRFEMVVLSMGMEISDSAKALGEQLGIQLDEHGFCQTTQLNPLESSRPGIYAIGPFREPKDIPESVIEASGAAASAAARLAPARFSLVTQREFPPERDVTSEEPRIGVFVCSCGSNIGGFIDVPDVATYAMTLPNVVHAEWNLYTCSQDSIKHITEQINAYDLNRVVVASCTPLTHQPLFQDSLRSAGLNPYLFEMANIRNQCSWVHSTNLPVATTKAKDLIRMAAARAIYLSPQQTFNIPIQHSALVVGGGVAGMTSAISLADQGFSVDLVEKEFELGGNLKSVFTFFPEQLDDRQNKDPHVILDLLEKQVRSHPLITLHLDSQVTTTSGFMGNFTSIVQSGNGKRSEIPHGVTIIATGGQEYRGPEYLLGESSRVITQQQFESLVHEQPIFVQDLKSVVMIHCVGPAEKYCSRICCTISLKNAIWIKQNNPKAIVTILYKDIRTYGFKERIYTEARRMGIIFIRYDDDHKPIVNLKDTNAINSELEVNAWDPNLERYLSLDPDMVLLSMPVIPRHENRKIASMFKASTDNDGFLLEAHVKLRPVDFASDGVFMAGLAHYPKLIDETIIQAQAAAGRAARILSRDSLTAGGRVAKVDTAACTGCLTCVRICPFGVPQIQADLTGVGGIIGAAYIEASVCQGCGLCVAECPARAIQLMHYTDIQIESKIDALFNIEVN